jgi:hypothetical protein
MRCYVECRVRSAQARIARSAGHSRFLTSPFAADVHVRSKFCRVEKLLPLHVLKPLSRTDGRHAKERQRVSAGGA